MTKYAYSLDQERYYGQFDSVEEALADAVQAAGDDATQEGEHTRTVWIGEIAGGREWLRKRNPIFVATTIEEDAEEYLGDNIGWDDLIMELTPEKSKELGELVTEWLCNNATFNAYGIVNSKEYPVKVGAA